MYVSHETPAQTEERLSHVLATSRLTWFPGPYAFEEFPRHAYVFNPQALAVVRDEQVWSQLVPATSPQQEQFGVFSFHFVPGLDNSGFVGWLATRIKQQTGSGVWVICGQNSADGGIFDYWGCPAHIEPQVRALLQQLGAQHP